MKRLNFLLIILLLLTACGEHAISPKLPSTEPDNESEDRIVYQDGVVMLKDLGVEDIEIISPEAIELVSSRNIDTKALEGRIVIYQEENSSRNYFVGRVTDSGTRAATNNVVLHTEVPSMDEVYKELYLCPHMDNTNCTVGTIDDGTEHSTKLVGLVDNSIWDSIEVLDSTSFVSEDTVEVSTRAAGAVNGLENIDITLKFEPSTKDGTFSGAIFYRIKGKAIVTKNSLKMELTHIVGLEGKYKLRLKGESGRQKVKPPFLDIPHVKLYSNGAFSIDLHPSAYFYYSGSISMDTEFHHEIINVNTWVAYENGKLHTTPPTKNAPNNYFRVKSINASGEFGIMLECDVYGYLVYEGWGKGGVKLQAGVGLGGQGGAGIQFPGLVNFNANVYAKGFVEATPYASILEFDGLFHTTMKTYEGPKAKLEVNYKIPLIPDITFKDLKYENRDLLVNTLSKSPKNTLVQTKSNGVAVFKQGSNTPVIKKAVNGTQTRAATNDLAFDVEPGETYELAQYCETYEDGTIYGERVVVRPKEDLCCPDNNHPHAIDLGLPSGTKWACCNVGATYPEGYGGYYAWGETSEKSLYNMVTYKYCTGVDTDGDGWYDNNNYEFKYIGSNIAGTSYDVAHVRMGGSWQMPTSEQLKELTNNCRLTWTKQNEVYGLLLEGKNGQRLFLPATGSLIDNDYEDVGYICEYWTSIIAKTDKGSSDMFLFDPTELEEWDSWWFGNRVIGRSVRAVCP